MRSNAHVESLTFQLEELLQYVLFGHPVQLGNRTKPTQTLSFRVLVLCGSQGRIRRPCKPCKIVWLSHDGFHFVRRWDCVLDVFFQFRDRPALISSWDYDFFVSSLWLPHGLLKGSSCVLYEESDLGYPASSDSLWWCTRLIVPEQVTRYFVANYYLASHVNDIFFVHLFRKSISRETLSQTIARHRTQMTFFVDENILNQPKTTWVKSVLSKIIEVEWNWVIVY